MTRSRYLWTCLLISVKKRAAWLLALALLGAAALWLIDLTLAVWGTLSLAWVLVLLGHVALSSWRRHRDDWAAPLRPDDALPEILGSVQQDNGHS